MYCKTNYDSPVGRLLIAGDESGLAGLWLEGQKYYSAGIAREIEEKNDSAVLISAKNWLGRYFAGEKPNISELSLNPAGSDFRQEVWQILCEIPYGEYITYGDIAKKITAKSGKVMSGQAVGGAVGHNPISIIIPCHRVVGVNGSLTGYAGGIDKKIKLLKHEGADISRLHIPKSGTAL